MATLSATSATTKPSNSSILVDSLPFIDMTTLSQSELHSLSFLSSSHLRRSVADSVVSPSINRSSFNESAGSRRQTYSRPSPHHHHHHRHRLAANLPKSSVSAVDQPSNPSFEDPDRVENRSIIKCLKQLLSSHPDFEQPDFVELDFFNSHLNCPPLPEVTVVEGAFPVVGRKRKRGRRPKVKALAGFEKDREMGTGVLNKNGNVVDLIALAKLEDPYREELKRRTQGLQKEEELFGFFRELNGQWCSRRRKRKIVDANEFGDALPTGWKLLLGLKRKEGRAWVYCRRYISPGGQQFVSCKDVSEYLQSMPRTYSQAIDVGADVQLDHGMSIAKSHGGIAEMEDNFGQPKENKKEIALLDDLAEIQIRDLFECHVCNRSFNERGSYLQHLSSLHQKTSRHESGSPGDGVIIKDGNYECHFCHKVFEERCSYDSHLAMHVKNCNGGTGESPHERIGLPQKIDSSEDELPTGISKMDALIEIAQNSVCESPSGASDHECKSNYPLGEPEVEDLQNCISTELCHQKNADDVIIDGKIEKNGETIPDVAVNILSSSVQVKDEGDSATPSPGSSNRQKAICDTHNILGTGTVDHPNRVVIDNVQTFEVDIGFGDIACMRDMIGQQKTEQQYLEEHEPCNTVPGTPASLLQLPMSKTTFDEENGCNATNARNGKTGFEELSIEDIDQLRYSYGSGEEPVFLYDMEIDIENNANINTTKCFSELFGSDGIDIADRQQLTTVCIWCGVEFIDEALDADVQSESVGYMCPTCKAKTSGQIDMMDAGCL